MSADAPKPRMTVWHMEPVTANGSTNLIAHARGEVRSEVTEAINAIDEAAAQRGIVDLGSDPQDELDADARARKAWLKSRKQGGRPPNPYVEFLLAGPPRYDDADRLWPESKELEWAKSARQWVAKRFPDSKVVVASLHRDEAAPHVHIVLSPAVVTTKGERQWGWCKARNVAAVAALNERIKGRRRTPKRMTRTNSRKALSLLQDDCHAHTGEKYGLDRGKRGSRAKHQAVDQAKSVAARAKALHQELKVRESKVVAAGKRVGNAAKRVAQREADVREIERQHGDAAKREADAAQAVKDAEDAMADVEAAAARNAAMQEQLEHEAARLKRQQAEIEAADERVQRRARSTTAKRNRVTLAMKCVQQAIDAVDEVTRSDALEDAHAALHAPAETARKVYHRYNPRPKDPPASQTRGQVVDFPKPRR